MNKIIQKKELKKKMAAMVRVERIAYQLKGSFVILLTDNCPSEILEKFRGKPGYVMPDEKPTKLPWVRCGWPT